MSIEITTKMDIPPSKIKTFQNNLFFSVLLPSNVQQEQKVKLVLD